MASKKRLSTGSRGIDLILSGGVPQGTILLLEGPPGIGKRDIACHFLKKGRENSEKLALAYRGYGPNEIGAFSDGSSMCPKDISLIECSGDSLAPANIRCNVGELFTVADAIKSYAKKNTGGRIVIDIMSDISMLHTPQQAYKFLSQIVSVLKATKTTCILIVDEGMQDQSALVSVEHACDVVVQLRLWEEGLNVTPVARIKKFTNETFDRDYFIYEKLKQGIKMVKST